MLVNTENSATGSEPTVEISLTYTEASPVTGHLWNSLVGIDILRDTTPNQWKQFLALFEEYKEKLGASVVENRTTLDKTAKHLVIRFHAHNHIYIKEVGKRGKFTTKLGSYN